MLLEEYAGLGELATSTFNCRYVAEVHALSALIHDGAGDRRGALDIRK